MEEKGKRNCFNGAAWFDRQVSTRTRDALEARGSKARTHSREYQTEYARQLLLFRAERAEVKRLKREKHLARMEKKMASGEAGM